MKTRIEGLREMLRVTGHDAYISLAAPINQYLTGFTGTTSATIVTQEETLFLCDFRYTEQAAVQVQAFAVSEVKGGLPSRLGERLTELRAGTAVFEPGYMSVAERESIAKAFHGTLATDTGMTAPLRMVKSAQEIEAIRQALKLSEAVLAEVLETLEPGITELDVAAAIEYGFKKRGASGPSFDTIALFGARSSLPHGMPSDRALTSGDIVLLDFGCRLHGYCSDLTRTCAFGTIPGIWFEEIHETVLSAQRQALEAVKPGMTGKELDAVARDHIAAAGHAKHFGHGLGHGLGIEIHEAPRLNTESETVLLPGMVVTIEPGIYLPGQGGVRIEDVIAITDTGCEILSSAPKLLKVMTE